MDLWVNKNGNFIFRGLSTFLKTLLTAWRKPKICVLGGGEYLCGHSEWPVLQLLRILESLQTCIKSTV